MPITLAHPLAVLPFVRHLRPAPLIAGSVAPDVVYYAPIPLTGSTTHSGVAALGWDVLIGLALLAVFRVSASPATALLPYRVSLPDPTGGDGVRRRAVSTVFAIGLGAATHIVWDSCTQTTGFVVRHWDLLLTPIAGPHKAYNVLGYVSSIAGTAVIVLLLCRRAVRLPSATLNPWRGAVLTALLVAALLGAVLAVDDPAARVGSYDLIRHMIVGAAEFLCYAWMAYVVAWQIRPGVRSRPRVRRR